jgi:hypothetical protein
MIVVIVLSIYIVFFVMLIKSYTPSREITET